MAETVTALELVNDLLRLHRMETVTTFANVESGATEMLQLVNKAISAVLNSQDWEFALRHDGLLMTQAKQTGSQLVLGTTTANFTILDFGGSTDAIVDTGVARLRATNSTSFANTAFRIKLLTAASPPNMIGEIERVWPGSAYSSDAWETFAAEYVLPSTVRKVVSCQHQEESVAVAVLRPSARLEEVIPRPWDNIGDNPEFIAVGGESRRTYISGSGEPDRGLRAIIFPVPESRYALNYSYYERFPRLADTTDTLEITTEARETLVDWAYAHSNLTAIGNDPRLGAAMKQDVRFEMTRAKKAAETSAARATIQPYAERGSVRRRFREPITDPFA